MKELFCIPTFSSLGIDSETPDKECIYFCGNSLGLMPKETRPAINRELDAWAERGVESHFNHKSGTPWVEIDLPLLPLLAPIVGAKESEVAAMGTLTANLNALLVSFYKPKGKRTKILFEKQAFPSDYYAFLNLVKLHGYDESHLVQMAPKEGHTYLETQDILDTIDAHSEELAVVCFPGIQYYTGQFFKMGEITQHIKTKYPEIVVGWDLAHAVGNVPLSLHDWGVDFAAWCSYKYLNSGPGGMAGIFVHEKHTKGNSSDNFPPRLAGWWGNDYASRFQMLEKFDPISSALSYRQSNPSVIDVVAVRTSLEIFKRAGGVETLRKKSIELTNHLQHLLQKSKYYIEGNDTRYGFRILTPLNEHERGAQLSLLFQHPSRSVMDDIFGYMRNRGVICDERRPDVIRLAPLPLYNTMEEVERAVEILEEALHVNAN